MKSTTMTRPPSVRRRAQFDEGVWSKQLLLTPLKVWATTIRLRRLGLKATITSWWTYVLGLNLILIYYWYGIQNQVIGYGRHLVNTSQPNTSFNGPAAIISFVLIGVGILTLLLMRGFIRHQQYREIIKKLDARPLNQSKGTKSYGKSLSKRVCVNVLFLVLWLLILFCTILLVKLSSQRIESDLRGTSSIMLYLGIFIFVTSSLILLGWHRCQVIIESVSSRSLGVSLRQGICMALGNIAGLLGAGLWGGLINILFLLWIFIINIGLYWGITHVSTQSTTGSGLLMLAVAELLLMVGIWYQQVWSKNYWARLYYLFAHRTQSSSDYLG